MAQRQNTNLRRYMANQRPHIGGAYGTGHYTKLGHHPAALGVVRLEDGVMLRSDDPAASQYPESTVGLQWLLRDDFITATGLDRIHAFIARFETPITQLRYLSIPAHQPTAGSVSGSVTGGNILNLNANLSLYLLTVPLDSGVYDIESVTWNDAFPPNSFGGTSALFATTSNINNTRIFGAYAPYIVASANWAEPTIDPSGAAFIQVGTGWRGSTFTYHFVEGGGGTPILNGLPVTGICIAPNLENEQPGGVQTTGSPSETNAQTTWRFDEWRLNTLDPGQDDRLSFALDGNSDITR